MDGADGGSGSGCLRASTHHRGRLTSRTEDVDLAWEGDLDIASAPVLGAALAVLCDREMTSIALDVSGVTFLDCAGLNVLLHVDDRLLDRLVLLHPSPPVLRLLEVAELAEHFPSHLPSRLLDHLPVQFAGDRRPQTPPRDPKSAVEDPNHPGPPSPDRRASSPPTGSAAVVRRIVEGAERPAGDG